MWVILSTFLLSIALSPLSLFPLSCLWSRSIKFSSDLDPIIFSTNWFQSPVDLTVNFFSNLSYASCSNLNPIFLFLSFLTNENCLFLYGRLPRCVCGTAFTLLHVFSDILKSYHRFWRRKPDFNLNIHTIFFCLRNTLDVYFPYLSSLGKCESNVSWKTTLKTCLFFFLIKTTITSLLWNDLTVKIKAT